MFKHDDLLHQRLESFRMGRVWRTVTLNATGLDRVLFLTHLFNPHRHDFFKTARSEIA